MFFHPKKINLQILDLKNVSKENEHVVVSISLVQAISNLARTLKGNSKSSFTTKSSTFTQDHIFLVVTLKSVCWFKSLKP